MLELTTNGGLKLEQTYETGEFLQEIEGKTFRIG